MIYRHRNTGLVILLFGILIVSCVVISNYIHVPYKIKTFSEVFPKERWILTSGNGGQIISNLMDFTLGHTTQYNISQFERGEIVNTDLGRFLKNKFISEGDTIAVLYSSYMRDQLVTAEGDLEIAKADLVSKNSAQKEPVIREAVNRLKYIKEKINEQQILFERSKQLFEKGFCSQQEYELQKWELELLEIEEAINRAQVDDLKTGVKSEEINLLRTQINALSVRLSDLKEKESKLTIISPIRGEINSVCNSDTLLNIINDTQVIFFTPIRITDLHDISEGQKIMITNDVIGNNESFGEILHINRQAKIMDAQQVVFISILLDNPSRLFLPGMVIENSLQLKNISLLDSFIKLVSQ